MSFKLEETSGVTAPKGYKACGVTCGLKRSGAPDFAMIYSETPCVVAGAFTSNIFAAAPVIYDRELVSHGKSIHAVAVNSGNANACTGEEGLKDARKTAEYVAEKLGLKADSVLVSSTGRIGVPMPMDIILHGVDLAVDALAEDGGETAARAIMTTDTVPKAACAELAIGGKTVRIGAMTKGAGMIAPKLKPTELHATMLCYVTTDAAITRRALHECIKRAIGASFNRITIDGDTSTNDTVLAFANAQAQNPEIDIDTPEFESFYEAFEAVTINLAKRMVLDGEGAGHFVEVTVRGAASAQDAKICCESIANSALCKTAWCGCDPNWGRVLCAAGYSGISFDASKANLTFGGLPVVKGGMDAGTPEATLVEILRQRSWGLVLDLGTGGNGEYTVWTSDLTHEYVTINADYHT